VLAGPVTAQKFTVLYDFSALSHGTNGDGYFPRVNMLLSSDTLYGTTDGGGTGGNGTIFALKRDGTAFTVLHSFTEASGSPYRTNSDGVWPRGSLILSGSTLYGTTTDGGSGYGTVFAVNIDGGNFVTLTNFVGGGGAGVNPQAGLVLSGDTLYGTTTYGGSGNGTVFAVSVDGTGLTNLHIFGGAPNDGAFPQAGLILSGRTLYGTTTEGGSGYNGTVFALNVDSTAFTNLHTFEPASGEGAGPQAGLILSGNTLYGTTESGGDSSYGTVFKVNTDGTGFATLHSFTSLSSSSVNGVNGDGAWLTSGLVLSGNTLYGTARYGGPSANGTVFAVTTDGQDFSTLYAFTKTSSSYPYTNSDGAVPTGGLVLSGNALYGTAANGGNSGAGTVFALSFTPQLTITPAGTNLVLSWPTNVVGFDYTGYILQSSTNLSAPAWTTNSPVPVVANGQYTVTNAISGTQQFFRLSQ
jgi:uncharacterized repeat protein (TIGR03803 family)